MNFSFQMRADPTIKPGQTGNTFFARQWFTAGYTHPADDIYLLAL